MHKHLLYLALGATFGAIFIAGWPGLVAFLAVVAALSVESLFTFKTANLASDELISKWETALDVAQRKADDRLEAQDKRLTDLTNRMVAVQNRVGGR